MRGGRSEMGWLVANGVDQFPKECWPFICYFISESVR
jgi:hypothetical protein